MPFRDEAIRQHSSADQSCIRNRDCKSSAAKNQQRYCVPALTEGKQLTSVVNLKFGLEASEHRDGLFDRRFLHHYRLHEVKMATLVSSKLDPIRRDGTRPRDPHLESPGQSSVLLDRLPVLVQSRSARDLQTPRKTRLEHVARVEGSFGLATGNGFKSQRSLPGGFYSRYTDRPSSWWISSMKPIVSEASSRSWMRFFIFSSNDPRTPVCFPPAM